MHRLSEKFFMLSAQSIRKSLWIKFNTIYSDHQINSRLKNLEKRSLNVLVYKGEKMEIL